MDTTPNPKMLHAMNALVDALCGEEPHMLMAGPGATQVREKRAMAMTILHDLVRLSMREGVNRAIREARERRAGPQDAEDRAAIDQAKDDAQGGKSIIRLPVKH